MNVLSNGEVQTVELVSSLLKAEKLVVSRLRKGEISHKVAANLVTRINTGMVTFVRDALDDRELAEEMVRTFDEAIEDGYTAVPPVVSTLAKVLAMRHDIEFNGHTPSEKKLRTNLVTLKTTLDLDNIDEQLSELKKGGVEQANQPGEKRGDNQMFG